MTETTVIPNEVKEELLKWGYPDDGDVVLEIPVENLEDFGTACGKTPRKDKCFGEGIRSFLLTRGVEVVAVLVDKDTPTTINAMAIPIKGRDRHIFASNVGKAGGSLRAESGDHPIPGWSMFESE